MEIGTPEKEKEAVELCKSVNDAVNRKYGGKILSLEQFVIRRGSAYGKVVKCEVLK